MWIFNKNKKPKLEGSIDPHLCLAKTEETENGVTAGLSVEEHGILTAEVGLAIRDTHPVLRNADLLPSSAIAICALHDIGKISRSFQQKISSALDDGPTRLEAFGLSPDKAYEEPLHPEISRYALEPVLGESKAIVAGRHTRRMFSAQFPEDDVSKATLHELRGKVGLRVRALYKKMADKYQVGWTGRSYTPGKFELSDTTNKIMTSANTALYALSLSAIIATGHSPHVGFVHTGSPLPFVYDMADMYKADLSIDFAFRVTHPYPRVGACKSSG